MTEQRPTIMGWEDIKTLPTTERGPVTSEHQIGRIDFGRVRKIENPSTGTLEPTIIIGTSTPLQDVDEIPQITSGGRDHTDLRITPKAATALLEELLKIKKAHPELFTSEDSEKKEEE